MQAPTKDQLKERAKHLCEIMLEKYSVKVKQGHSLEIVSRLFGIKDWNTASAMTEAKSIEKPVETLKAISEKQMAAKFRTVGELKEFLSMFDEDTKLVVNEYQWSELDPNNFGTLTSVCSLTYDYEIQSENELRLELNTEAERNDHSIGKGSSQTFDRTEAGRSQRRIKYLYMQNSFWNSKSPSDRGTNFKS